MAASSSSPKVSTVRVVLVSTKVVCEVIKATKSGVGSEVGAGVGTEEGAGDGIAEGMGVGASEGKGDGELEGKGVGVPLGS